ncbi:MAG: type II CRISPR RNA-guided endonuclease Cas9, partial [Chloroflexi bacterium]|nr:type II CRISPR RNA-guided endonuclease Cas9 [Chloroflexota bacterium]
MRKLDASIARCLRGLGITPDQKKLYHQLRAAALEHPIPRHLVGRALLHLGQRRGYLSNSKRFRSAEEDEDLGPVESQIKETAEKLGSGHPTVGHLLASLDPAEERIRSRWLGRGMIKDEFDKIVAAQSELGLDLKEYAKKHIRRVAFFQRPLRSAKGLVGRCELEGDGRIGPRRCARAHPIAQEFRYLQKLNDLRLINKSTGEVRELTKEERTAALDLLEAPAGQLNKSGKLSFAKLRAAVGLDKPKQWTTNFESGGDKDIPYAGTLTGIRQALNEEWDQLVEDQKTQLVVMILGEAHDEALVRLVQSRLGISEDAAGRLTEIRLEPGYAQHSRKALEKLLVLMRQGDAYMTARQEIYGADSGGGIGDQLPGVNDVIPNLTNPTVYRALTQLRKVVNAVIKEHDKPDKIRVELARDLKRNRKQRDTISSENRARAKIRENAKDLLIELGFETEPKRRDIEKYLLWQECRERCPYTGRQISFSQLFGPNPQFDVEHIIPLSRSLDDSYFNKTLCESKENREIKRNQTPFECYSGNPDQYERILTNVAQFTGDRRASEAKLKRFKQEEVEEGFAKRHLNDTRYASVLACKYLGELYGGPIDASGTTRVQVTTGGLTAVLRSCWDLNALIGWKDQKNREDHRHHAIDAAVVSVTDQGLVGSLQRAARDGGYRRLSHLPIGEPGPNFRETLQDVIDELLPSKALSRRVRGALHQETNYAPAIQGMGARKRVRLASLTKRQVKQIVDPVVRRVIQESLGDEDPKKRFAANNPQPLMPNTKGLEIPIKNVRIESTDSLTEVGRNHRKRHVRTGANHHLCVYINDETGKGRYEVISLLEAHQRVSAGEPWMQRNPRPDERFLYSLTQGDVLMPKSGSPEEAMVITGISAGEITCRLARDGRTAVDRIAAGGRIRFQSPNGFVAQGLIKV